MRLRDVTIRLKLDTTSFKAQAASAAATAKQTGTAITTGSAQGAKSLGLLRAGYATVGLAAGTAGVTMVRAAADFEQAMANVNATNAVTHRQLEALEQQALEFGRTTTYSSTEAASGMESLLKAGISAEDVIGGGLKGALDLAAAGELEVGNAAEIAAGAMAQFNLEGKDTAHIADVLAAGAGKAQGSVHDIGMGLAQVGGVASQFNQSLEGTVGMLAAMAEQGYIGSDAATSVKTALLRLVRPVGDAEDMIAKYNIATRDSNGEMLSFEKIAGQLRLRLGDLSAAERDKALATIFGTDAIRAATVMYKNGESGIAGWTAKVDDAGYSADVAAKKTDTLRGDLDRMKNSWRALAEGSGGSGGLRPTVQRVGDLADGLGLVDRALDKVRDGFRDLAPKTELSNLQATIIGAKAIVEGLDWHVAIRFKTEGTPGAIKDAAAVARAAGLVPTEVRSYLELLNWSPEGIDAVLSKMNQVDQRQVVANLKLMGIDVSLAELEALDADMTQADATTVAPDVVMENLPESQKALIDFWSDLLQVEKVDPEVDISVDNDDALSKIREVMDAIRAMTSLTGFVEVYGGRAMGGAIEFSKGGHARGAIRGAGGPTQDSIPARLSNGEHVLTASDVKKAGGQDAIYAMRRAIQAGALHFAAGGEPSRSYAAGSAVSTMPTSFRTEIGISIRDVSFDSKGVLTAMQVVATDAAGRVLAEQVFEAAIA